MVLLIIGGIVIAFAGFWIAAELIARGTETLEPMIGQGMTGGVVLGLMGALPETMFVIIATLSASYGIAVGAAIGGNIILFTLGIGIIGILYTLKWNKPIVMKEDYHVEMYFLLLSTAVLALLLLYGSLDRISGAVLLLIYVAYVAYRYAHSHRRIVHHASTAQGRRQFAKAGLLIVGGTAIIVFLSGFFVGLISQLSAAIGIPALIVAIVIAPIVADLDELISAYRIAVRTEGGGSTAIVSFIGSKLQNNTMLIGLIGLLAAQSVGLGATHLEFGMVIAVNLVAVVVIMKRRLAPIESALLIGVYLAIITYFLAIA